MPRATMAASVLLLALSPRLAADNAIPVATREADGVRIVLFSHSAPVRAGMVELSLMVLDAKSGEPMVGWTASGRLEPISLVGEDAWVAPCCRLASGADGEAAVPVEFASGGGNARFAAATTLVLARPGTWSLALRIDGPDGGLLAEAFEFEVAPPRTPLSQYWPWIAAIPVAVVGFAFSRP